MEHRQDSIIVQDTDSSKKNVPRDAALFISAFIDELMACGVHNVVISPGSRSTALSVIAHESGMRVFVDVDERGAAFLALGLAKASGMPACAICTSGTAVANYYPAVMEAEISRVPLILLTADRPLRDQQLGAPQTCDQIKAFSNHVRFFQQMPSPSSADSDIAFARHIAKTAFYKAAGSYSVSSPAGSAAGIPVGNVAVGTTAKHTAGLSTGATRYGCMGDAGPVHLNFPLDEPLLPDLSVSGLFECGRGPLRDKGPLHSGDSLSDSGSLHSRDSLPGSGSRDDGLSPIVEAEFTLPANQTKRLAQTIASHRTVIFAGEGSCENSAQAHDLLLWAKYLHIPIIADPLSGLRSFDDPLIIDSYDTLFGTPRCPPLNCVIRFGRYPISKTCFIAAKRERPVQIVVDLVETRDFLSATDVFVRTAPPAFVQTLAHALEPAEAQAEYAHTWVSCNDTECERLSVARGMDIDFPAPFIIETLDKVPAESLVFSASSTTIRLIDTFYRKSAKPITLMCNRGLNGIDGVTSTMVGAAHYFEQTVFLTGDLTFLHDMNALLLHREIMDHAQGGHPPKICIVLFNNAGGGLFNLLPQRSDDAYFERLFTVAQTVDYQALANAFGIPYRKAVTIDEFSDAYLAHLGMLGLSIIEVPLSMDGLKEHYGEFR